MKTYIQLGANTGNDEFQSILEKSSERLRVFLLEPNTDLLDQLARTYEKLMKIHDVTICPYGISLESGVEDLYMYGTINGNYSLVNRRTHPLTPETTSKKIVTKTFEEFCNTFNIQDIELLFIDTEGLDYEILNSINLLNVNINTIIFEEWVHDQDDQNNKYRTGPLFLHHVIVPKFYEYHWEEFVSGGMNNFRLTKKPS